MQIRNIDHANQQLHALYELALDRLGDDSALQRMQPLLAAVGNPHQKLAIVHVAGTSGKTSTSYYIAALLRSSGKAVGLSVSPHVTSIVERLQVNGVPVSEAVFCEALGRFMDVVDTMEETPSYFELMISFMYWFFAQQRMDYVVVETGLGGLLDASNVAQRADKVCVITDIGYDHMAILGNDITSIAQQKAGIIHGGNHVFMHRQGQEVMDAVHQRVAAQSAQLQVLSEQEGTDAQQQLSSKVAPYQKRNWVLARYAVEYIARRDQLSIDPDAQPHQVAVPGRMEVQQRADATYILDGAHNAQKMQAFVDSFRQLYPQQKALVLLSTKRGKEYKEVLQILVPITRKLIITSFKDSQDFPIQSEDTEHLAQQASRLGLEAVVVEDTKQALAVLQADEHERIKIITGSIYLVGQLRMELFDA